MTPGGRTRAEERAERVQSGRADPVRRCALDLCRCLCPRRSRAKAAAPCRTTPSAICSASRPSARATGSRSAAWSTAARPACRSRPRRSRPNSTGAARASRASPRSAASPTRCGSCRACSSDDRTGGRQLTTGTPIALMIENTDQRSKDYSEIRDSYRPGHADYTYDAKYGIRDYRGGGRSSARETAARVAAGAVARKVVPGRHDPRRPGPDGPARHRPVALGLGGGRQQPVLLPRRRDARPSTRPISTGSARTAPRSAP